MTREVLIATWCDVCSADGDKSPGVPYEIAGILAGAVEVDVCERHASEIGLTSLAVALDKFGRVNGRPSSSPSSGRRGRKPSGKGDLVCPWCPLLYASSTAIHSHVDKVHGIEWNGQLGLSGLFGGRCPLCAEPAPQLAQHCRNEHGKSWGAVYLAAFKAGDPHGLCAPLERRAQEVSR